MHHRDGRLPDGPHGAIMHGLARWFAVFVLLPMSGIHLNCRHGTKE
jgi:hypothetical protein